MLIKELQFAVRNLRRSPIFGLACVCTLALALAGTATLVSLLETFVFRPLPVPEPDRLIAVYPVRNGISVGFSQPAMRALTERLQVATGVCGVTAGYGALNIQFDSRPIRLHPVEAVDGACYALLGVVPAVGRLIRPDDVPALGNPSPVAVISERVWRQEYDAAPDIVGRVVRLEGTPLTIVGVLPASYRGMNADEAPDLAVPLPLTWTLRLYPPLVMHAVVRLRPEIGLEQAARQVREVWPEVSRSTRPPGVSAVAPDLQVVSAASGLSVLRDRYRRPLYTLAALAGCLLLLACVNVGGLSLSRMLDRREAYVVQRALGASRLRLTVQVLWESALLGFVAIGVAAPIAWRGAGIVVHWLWTGDRPLTIEVTPGAQALLLTSVFGVLATIIIAIPRSVALFAHLWDLEHRPTGRAASRYPQRIVTAAQLALCFTLAFCAMLFVSDLWTLRRLPLGYDPTSLQWAQLDSTSRRTMAPTLGYSDAILQRLGALPGVERVAMATTFGRVDNRFAVSSRVPVWTGASVAAPVESIVDPVSPEFFRTAGIPLQGREFTWTDVRNRTLVAIANRSLADRLFPDGEATGQAVVVRLGTLDVRVEVVGVAGDATPGDPRIQQAAQLYVPLGPTSPPAPIVLLRARSGGITAASVRDAIEPYGRHQVVAVGSMNDRVNRFLAQERLITSTSSIFAVLAGIVGLAGLFATMSLMVIRRTGEIGIRVAVGATPATVRALVLTEALRIVGLGLGLGIPIALAGRSAAHSLRSSDRLPDDVVLLAATAATVCLAAFLVSLWPARRAACIEVKNALRSH